MTLQQLLASKGFSPGAADGVFGPHTEAEVRAFQSSRHLVVDGVVGRQTWAALRAASGGGGGGGTPPTLTLGSTGGAVAILQTLLARKGFSPGAADGIFGPHTLAEVRAFQASRGLDVDGIVGPQTWYALTH